MATAKPLLAGMIGLEEREGPLRAAKPGCGTRCGLPALRALPSKMKTE
jgi:hypothetical protein